LGRHQQALEALAGLRGDPLWHTIQRLDTALPQVAGSVAIEPIVSNHGYLSFLGPYRIGPGVSDCVRAAAEEADRVLTWGQRRNLGRGR
jgi:protoporphyrinogen oxidase